MSPLSYIPAIFSPGLHLEVSGRLGRPTTLVSAHSQLQSSDVSYGWRAVTLKTIEHTFNMRIASNLESPFDVQRMRVLTDCGQGILGLEFGVQLARGYSSFRPFIYSSGKEEH